MNTTISTRKTHYAAIEGWHGEEGHFNIFKRDHESVCTGHGQHDRVLSTLPQFDKQFGKEVLYCRVDTKWNLGEPTVEQILKVARKTDGTKGQWKLIAREPWDNGTSIGFYFSKVK